MSWSSVDGSLAKKARDGTIHERTTNAALLKTVGSSPPTPSNSHGPREAPPVLPCEAAVQQQGELARPCFDGHRGRVCEYGWMCIYGVWREGEGRGGVFVTPCRPHAGRAGRRPPKDKGGAAPLEAPHLPTHSPMADGCSGNADSGQWTATNKRRAPNMQQQHGSPLDWAAH